MYTIINTIFIVMNSDIENSDNENSDNENSDIYDINQYSDAELFDMLDLTNPSDRELEAKIIMTIKKYAQSGDENSKELETFFENVYNHFFENSDDENSDNDYDSDIIEGMTSKPSAKPAAKLSAKPAAKPEAKPDKKSSKTPASKSSKISSMEPLSTPAAPVTINQQFEYTSGNVNPLLKETQKRVIHVDSQHRDYTVYPTSTDYTVNLSDPILNAVSLRLHSVTIPYSWYNVSNVYNSNYFYIIGVSPGIENITYKFQIQPGIYDPNGLVTAIQNAIAQSAINYPNINFGTTSITYSPITLKMKFTLDVQAIYTENDYYLSIPSPPSTEIGYQSVPGYLGFTNSTYALSAIYSNFNDAKLITGYTTPINNPVQTNPFDLTTQFQVIANDPSNNIKGNNYFTIYNYSGTILYDPSNSTILDTINVIFTDTSGIYTRETIINNINSAISSNPYLTSNSYLQAIDISQPVNYQYTTVVSGTFTMQRYELSIELNTNTTHIAKNMKQIIIFPDESTFTPPISKLWTGLQSCFLFNEDPYLCELNNVIAETTPLDYYSYYTCDTSMNIQFRCLKTGYDISLNTFVAKIPNSPPSINYPYYSPNDYTNGYFLNNIIGINNGQYINGQPQYLNSIVNQKLKLLSSPTSQNGASGYINAEMYLDVTDNYIHTKVDIFQNFDQTTYTLDISNSVLHTRMNLPSIINTDPSGINVFNSSFLFTFGSHIDIISGDHITLIPKSGCGNHAISPYIIYLPPGTYYDMNSLQTAINQQFASIQGKYDICGNLLNGLNMSQTKISLILPQTSSTVTCKFTYVVSNPLTQNDYAIFFGEDVYPSQFKYPQADFSLPRGIYGSIPYYTLWSMYFGMNSSPNGQYDAAYQYNLNNSLYATNLEYSELISGQIQQPSTVINATNNVFSFNPLSSLNEYSSNPKNTITITIPLTSTNQIYSKYGLYAEINRQFANNPITKGSIITSYFDSNGNEFAYLYMNINNIYTAQDYALQFFSTTMFPLNKIEIAGVTTFKNTTWDLTIGWQLGFRSFQSYILSPTNANNAAYVTYNSYTYDPSTNIITLTADTGLNMFLFNNFYIILNDYTQNHLNDGLVTVTKNSTDIASPSYASPAYQRADPTGQIVNSFYNSDNPGYALTQNQLYAATEILNNAKSKPQIYSTPPYLKDMFALIPLKLSGLQPGQPLSEFGGMLQDNDRKYFGPVNVRRITVQLVNDHGDIVNLNGTNWSFSIVCEYLYIGSRKIDK